MITRGGLTEREKFPSAIVSGKEKICVPSVPVTEKARLFPATPFRPLTVKVLVAPALMEVGLKAHVAGVAIPHVKLMLSVKVVNAVAAEIVNVVVSTPAPTVIDGTFEAREKTAVPVPVRVTAWGLPVALSVRVIVDVLTPVAVGVKVTLIVHLAPAAKVVGQSLVCA